MLLKQKNKIKKTTKDTKNFYSRRNNELLFSIIKDFRKAHFVVKTGGSKFFSFFRIVSE